MREGKFSENSKFIHLSLHMKGAYNKLSIMASYNY